MTSHEVEVPQGPTASQPVSATVPPDGSLLLGKLQGFIRRFVFLSEPQNVVVALWVVHTFTFESADATPYLTITSAEKQCGKSRLLEVLESLAANAWLTGRVSVAVLARKVEKEKPTLLLDETDASFKSGGEYAETLRGVLNTGHRRGGKYSCCVKKDDDFTLQDFSTFCPKALAGIGRLPDTIEDRAIQIRLRRAAPGEVPERFRRRNTDAEVKALREDIKSWCTEIMPQLVDARPDLPNELTDRQQDAVEPLLAIADIAGGDWPRISRDAVVELCTEGRKTDESIGFQLLSDIRQIFNARSVDRLPSSELAATLANIETAPWCEWSNGRPLNAAKLARLLKPYGIGPEVSRIGEKTPRCYLRASFDDAFKRYLRESGPCEAPQSATPQHCAEPNEDKGIPHGGGAGEVDPSKRGS